MQPHTMLLLFMSTHLLCTLSQMSTVFDGVWKFEHADRHFLAHICVMDEDAIYMSVAEQMEDASQYTIGVSYFDKITDSERKSILAGRHSFVLSQRGEKNKNGYFESIFIVRYEKEKDEMYLHFKLFKKERPTNILMTKDVDNEDFDKFTCWVPPYDFDIKAIDGRFPQIWKSKGMHRKFRSVDYTCAKICLIFADDISAVQSEDNNYLVLSRKKTKEGCFGWADRDGRIQSESGGYLTAIEYGYDGKLMMFKWFDVGSKHKKGAPCKSGSGMFMVIGQVVDSYVASFSWQCDDGTTGQQLMLELAESDEQLESKYKCPMLVAAKTDL